jgi:type I site-specific restriction-modification system R (restriction) subunit
MGRLKKLQTDVIISGGHNDLPRLKAYADKSKHETSIKSFKLPFDSEDEGVTGDIGIVIVRDMLLTGFDAPVEQVMYLDKVIVAHNLLQAIARVNRVGGEGKDKGFVVDYVGIGHHLKKAITISDEREQKEVLDALSFPEKELNDLRAKHRGITDAYLESKGISLKVAPISILDQDFESQVGKRKRINTKAAEVEHAIRHHLDVGLDDDPDLQASFAEALKKILEDFQKNWKKIYEELEKLRKRIINARKEPTYGLHRKKQMPLFRMLRREIFGDEDLLSSAQPGVAETQTAFGMTEEDRISHMVDLTQKIFLVVERELKLTGFWESIPARNKLKADLQKSLLAPEFAILPDLIKNRAHIISRIMEIAEKNNDTILYAE